MAKKKQNTTQTFGITIRIGSQRYTVTIRATGGRWIGKALRAVGSRLRWPVIATGAALATATALARLAF